MKAENHKKLIAAGFTIFQVDEQSLKLKVKSGSDKWKTFKHCQTPADLKRIADAMRQHPRNIED